MVRSRSRPQMNPYPYANPTPIFNQGSSRSLYEGYLETFANVLGISAFASLLSGPDSSWFNAAWLLVLGSIFETGRQVCRWAMDRFKVREYSSFRGSCHYRLQLSENRVLYCGGIQRGRPVLRMDPQLSRENHCPNSLSVMPTTHFLHRR